jgi:hypothetical protein
MYTLAGSGDFKIERKRRNSMHSLTYKDIIDEKIAEWRSGLKKLEEQAGKAPSDIKAKLNAKMEQLKSAIDTATVQLHNLDEQETIGNTMETKDKILKIFYSIDKDFTGYEDKTPYML